MKIKTFLLFFIFGILLNSCSSFKLEGVKYGWGGEVFINPDENGNIAMPKNSMNFNILPVLKEENLDQKPKDIKIRIIRDDDGYFYLTAHKFKYVWVFVGDESSLVLENKIEIYEDKPLDDPKFNEQKPHVKLFLKDGKEFILDKKGIVKAEENKK